MGLLANTYAVVEKLAVARSEGLQHVADLEYLSALDDMQLVKLLSQAVAEVESARSVILS